MSRWFRHYAGMMRDEKLVSVAIKSKQPVERVVWVWGALLESACEVNDGGRFEFDAGEASYFLRVGEDDILGILAALVSLGRISEGAVARWSDRQFESDKSKDRQKLYRERLKASRDGGVTSRDGVVTAQETETDTYTEAASSEAARCALDPRILESKMREAAGDKIQPSGGFVVGPVMELILAGADVDLDVLPAIRSTASKLTRPARSWAYFVPAIQDAFDRRKSAGTWERAQPPPGQRPSLTPHQQRHQAAINAFDRKLGITNDDEFTGNTLDLESRDIRSH
jgi:hypothetical protein